MDEAGLHIAPRMYGNDHWFSRWIKRVAQMYMAPALSNDHVAERAKAAHCLGAADHRESPHILLERDVPNVYFWK